MRKNRNRKLPYFNSFTRAGGVLGLTIEIGKLEGWWWCPFQKRMKGKTFSRLFFFFFHEVMAYFNVAYYITAAICIYSALCKDIGVAQTDSG